MENETGTLYLVPTPIGNLGDMTYRSVQILNNVDLILAEDTRTSGFLLKHYQISTSIQSFHAHNEHKRVQEITDKLKSGISIAQISDAGTPGISDPGYLLVREALKNDIKVDALPGATAFVPALVKSGFPCDRFVFEGFLPHKKGRQTRIESLNTESRTSILYESPHRLIKLLEQFAKILGEQREISVSRELTKKFEETKTGSIIEVLNYFKSNTVKGEFVIVLAGIK